MLMVGREESCFASQRRFGEHRQTWGREVDEAHVTCKQLGRADWLHESFSASEKTHPATGDGQRHSRLIVNYFAENQVLESV